MLSGSYAPIKKIDIEDSEMDRQWVAIVHIGGFVTNTSCGTFLCPLSLSFHGSSDDTGLSPPLGLAD
ncbi:hypothetical protein Hypma_007696 [Hypsizygus marmoreus]|uniref:Uncharacterized protein n=1 Tax=Hypsizygus marmoreus TaxID=39966 RepID=A0A369JW56_HYPMA|nr:hypothetical protein Hypma_007696 [Hypsizygus marmoreus]